MRALGLGYRLPVAGSGSGVDLYVNNLAELDALFAANGIPSDAWDLIWPELGYASAGAADDAMAGDPGILKQDILDAWDSISSFTGALDSYSADLAGVYATSVLLSSWQSSDGRIVRVRAFDGASSQGEADILGFLSGGKYVISGSSLISNLDATASGRGLTTSSTLDDLLDTGVSDYDAFVVTQYDQSGNGLHMSQSTASLQPSLVLDTGKWFVQPDGLDDILTVSQPFGGTSIAIASVFTPSDLGINQFEVVFGGANYVDGVALNWKDSGQITFYVGGGAGFIRSVDGSNPAGSRYVCVGSYDGASIFLNVNGTEPTPVSQTGTATASSPIGLYNVPTGRPDSSKHECTILFSSAQDGSARSDLNTILSGI